MKAAFEKDRRESFIPCGRADLVGLCLAENRLSPDEQQRFGEFCRILSAYYHFKTQQSLEILKQGFAPFNPDAGTPPLVPPSEQALEAMADQLIQEVHAVLQGANFLPLSRSELAAAFEAESLIPLKTRVDFEDYEAVIFYYQGNCRLPVPLKRLWFQQKTLHVEGFERVAVLLRLKSAAHFEAKGQRLDRLDFTPGKIYLYLYKKIPRFDLELLFPNVQVSMNWKDRLMFALPAAAAAVPMILKVLPSLGLLVGMIFVLMNWGEMARFFNVDAGTSENIFPVMAAALSAGMVLGGFAFKQYSKYKSKRLQFLKKVTDTLFFKCLATNLGVLYTLVDAAEEETCKEIILLYYHLLTAETPMDEAALDAHIEAWLARTLGESVDFDIHKTLQNMAELRAPIRGETVSLLSRDSAGACSVIPLDQANQVIDYIWDHIFLYANPETSEPDAAPLAS